VLVSEKPRRNLVIIGTKPIMNYVVACLTLFNEGAGDVRIRARGKHINKAADLIELLRRVFLRDLKITYANTGTDVLTRDDGKIAHVSTIEIIIAAN